MKHSKRSTLTGADVRNAADLQDIPEPLGVLPSDPLVFRTTAPQFGEPVIYPKDSLVKISDYLAGSVSGDGASLNSSSGKSLSVSSSSSRESSLLRRKPPLEPTFSIHWLAVEGSQPSTPCNPAPSAITEQLARLLGADGLFADLSSPLPLALTDARSSFMSNYYDLGPSSKRSRYLTGTLPLPRSLWGPEDSSSPGTSHSQGQSLSSLPRNVKHIITHRLSVEHKQYFDVVVGAISTQDDPGLRLAVLRSLRTDQALHQLLPYLCQYIVTGVAANADNLPMLRSLMLLTHTLLTSSHTSIDTYLHQILPAVLTCLVRARLSSSSLEDHWSLRDFSATLLRHICAEHGLDYISLQPRIMHALGEALADPRRALASQFGALRGLLALGEAATSSLVIPQLSTVVPLLEMLLHPLAVTEATKVILRPLDGDGVVLSEHESDDDESTPRLPPSRRRPPDAARTASLRQLVVQQTDALRVHGAVVEAVAYVLNHKFPSSIRPSLNIQSLEPPSPSSSSTSSPSTQLTSTQLQVNSNLQRIAQAQQLGSLEATKKTKDTLSSLCLHQQVENQETVPAFDDISVQSNRHPEAILMTRNVRYQSSSPPATTLPSTSSSLHFLRSRNGIVLRSRISVIDDELVLANQLSDTLGENVKAQLIHHTTLADLVGV